MAFALQLQNSLRARERRIADEFAAGDSLEKVLNRDLLAVEAAAETELITSILLLDDTTKKLSHGAAPNLPKEYREAIDGSEIGPNAGSCGTAAYTGRATYVTDIATDPLWKDYRHLALPHGLRACWSTPILDPAGGVIGTFAIYHPTPRSPTPNEVEAIRLITDHVAQAILWSQRLLGEKRSDVHEHQDGAAGRLHSYAGQLDRYATLVGSERIAKALKAVAEDCRRLVEGGRNDKHKPSNDD